MSRLLQGTATLQREFPGASHEHQNIVAGTFAGGSTIFAIGILIFFVPPLADFYHYAMTSGSATGVPRHAPILWAAFLGALSYGALVTLVLDQAGSLKLASGVKAGALVGFLLWSTANLMLYAVSNVSNMTSTLVDPFVELIPGAIAGPVIAIVIRRIRHARRAG